MSLEHPKLDTLANELTQLMIDGGVRLSLLEYCPELLALGCVHELATGDSTAELAIAAEQIVKHALQLLGPGPRADVAQTLFAVKAGTKGLTTAARRRQAAELWGGDDHPGVSVAHFRKHLEAPLIRDLAYEIRKLDQVCRERAAQPEPKRRARRQGTMPEWRHQMMVERLPTYYRLWRHLSDLNRYLDLWREAEQSPTEAPDGEADAEEYSLAALHAYVRFLLEVENFNEGWGGIWVLEDPDEELRAAQAVQDIRAASPFSPIDESHLRTTLVVLVHQELAPFIAFLEVDHIGEMLITNWQTSLTTMRPSP